MTHQPDPTSEVIRSIEFRYLINRAFEMKRLGRGKAADAFAKCAEKLVREVIPLEREFALVAARKCEGRSVAATIASAVSPETAAAVWIVWVLRGARGSATTEMTRLFAGVPSFDNTINLLRPPTAPNSCNG